MREILAIPPGQDGLLFRHSAPQPRMPLRPARRMHAHDELECNLVTRGSARYLLGRGWHELRAHSMVWLFPDQEHLLVEESADFAMWVLVFTPQLVRRVCVEPDDAVLGERQPEGRFCRQLTPTVARRLEALCHEIAADGGTTALRNAGLAYALLHAWRGFAAAPPVPCAATAHPAIGRVLRLIRSGQTATLGQAALAAQAGLSPAHLSRLFKRQTGIALCDFRNQERVARFLELRENHPKLGLLDAARRAGFSSYPTFHRVFRRLMGVPPGHHPPGGSATVAGRQPG